VPGRGGAVRAGSARRAGPRPLDALHNRTDGADGADGADAGRACGGGGGCGGDGSDDGLLALSAEEARRALAGAGAGSTLGWAELARRDGAAWEDSRAGGGARAEREGENSPPNPRAPARPPVAVGRWGAFL
jgi:hypothetical protein